MSLIKVKSRGTDNVSSRRNLVINGAMQISQRIGTTATAITSGAYGIDRFFGYYSGNSWTTQQVVDAPAGFYNSMKLAVTGTTTPTYSFFGQKIEGYNVNRIGLGTANCQSFTVSFYVKSSVAGIYSISVGNGAGDLAYPVQYTINSTNTWERKSMTIPAITSGTWEVGNGTGIFLRFNMGSPSGRTDTANGWRSGNFDGADGSTGAVTWATTSGATYNITGLQVEVGDSASDFEHRSFGEEMRLCQRYFYSTQSDGGTADYRFAISDGANGVYINSYINLPVSMRATPSGTTTVAGAFYYNSGSGDSSVTPSGGQNASAGRTHELVRIGWYNHSNNIGGTHDQKVGQWYCAATFEAEL